jgi:tetratricopeptide (TPR) repeat protein
MTAGRRPFFVMELVNGLPLTRFCDQARLGIRARLELFAAICSAVQHAHQKGIIHRDLKPSNILVTLIDGRPVPRVIDFGVAKALGGKLTEESLSTQFGAVVGTLEYMAPEQAGYPGSDIDTRADVYSLGVILYELLTGLRPLDARRLRQAPLNEVIRIIQEEEPPSPSTRLSTAEALPSLAAARQVEPRRLLGLLRGELDWVVMKCLEKQRERRYETASALARDVQRYLADEPVEARPPSASYRLRKFVRRHPLELALAGALGLLLVGGVAVAWWQSEQAGARRETELRRRLQDEQRWAADNARLGRNAEAVAALLGQCEQALKAGDAAKAAVALDAARKRSTEGGADEQAARLGRLAADLALLRELDAVDQLRWTYVDNKPPDPAAVATRTREALRRFGADPDVTSVDEAAARVSASVVRERIVAALDLLLRPGKTAGVRAVLRRVDADPYRDAVRDAVLASNRAKFAKLARQKDALEQPPGFVVFLGASGEIKLERQRQLLRAAVGRRPRELGPLMTLGLSSYRSEEGGDDEPVRWFQAAVAAAPGNAAVLNSLGATLADKGQVDEAIVYYHKAIALDQRYAEARNNLGNALRRQGKVDEAIACFRKALALDPKLAKGHGNLGLALHRKGQEDEAIACYQKAIALAPKFAPFHTALGAALYGQGKVEEAIPYLRKAIALEPKYAPAHSSLGLALYDKGQVDEAIACYKKAIALDPKLAGAHNGLGAILCDVKRDYDGAVACFRKAIALDPKLAIVHTNLGTALYRKGKVDEAIACYRKAIALDPKDAKAHNNLGLALAAKGQVDEAIACYKKAIALDPKLAPAHSNLGVALKAKGKLDAAIASYRKAIALAPKDAVAHYNLGIALKGKGWLEEAISCYRKAIALDPRYAEAHCNLGGALQQQGRFAESLAAYQRGHELGSKRPGWRYPSAAWVRQAEVLAALEAKLPALLKGQYQPKDPAERQGLAGVCQAKQLHRAATGLYADAFAADPKLADGVHPGNRYDAAGAAAQAGSGQGNDASGDHTERARLRGRALAWLKDHLAFTSRHLAAGTAAARADVRRWLLVWQTDPALAGVRDRAALDKLPAEERAAWAKLWADVAALLKKAQTAAKREDQR